MSKNTTWLHNELYPALYRVVNEALLEFELVCKGDNWVSSNNLKITGERGDSVGKVYIWVHAPGFIKDFTRPGMQLINYIMKRDNLSFIDAAKYLASVAGINLPDAPEFENYDFYRDINALYEDASYYMRHCLCFDESDGAEEVRHYLTQKRGYTLEEIRLMHLGYLPSQQSLIDNLVEKGYAESFVRENINLNSHIGRTHKLAITWRSGGRILGFKFRTIGNDALKYHNNTGLKIRRGFFNLSPLNEKKHLIIVEGEFDALHATVRGIKDVVACGGNSVSKEQVEDAVKHGAVSFTLLYDTDGDGAEKKEGDDGDGN